MFNFDIGGLIVGVVLFGCALGGLVAAAAILAWPHLWAWLKPLLHAVTA